MFLLMVMAVGGIISAVASMDGLPILSPAHLITLLQNSKSHPVVVILRHAERCDRSSHACLGNPRGITFRGKQQVMAMGRAWRAVAPSPYRIMASNAVRTQQSAQGFSGRTAIALASQLDSTACKGKSFRSFIDRMRADKAGLSVLFSHSQCLSYIAQRFADKDFSPKYLEGLVLLIQPDGIEVAGTISPRLLTAASDKSLYSMSAVATVNEKLTYLLH